MNSVAGQVELVGLTVARGPQPHSIVTHNIETYKGSAVTEVSLRSNKFTILLAL